MVKKKFFLGMERKNQFRKISVKKIYDEKKIQLEKFLFKNMFGKENF